jgi:hypothetical protein
MVIGLIFYRKITLNLLDRFHVKEELNLEVNDEVEV